MANPAGRNQYSGAGKSKSKAAAARKKKAAAKKAAGLAAWAHNSAMAKQHGGTVSISLKTGRA